MKNMRRSLDNRNTNCHNTCIVLPSRLLVLIIVVVMFLPCLTALAGSNIALSLTLSGKSVYVTVTNSTDYTVWVRLLDNSGAINVDWVDIYGSLGATLTPTESGSFCYEVAAQDTGTDTTVYAKTGYFSYTQASPEIDMSGAYLSATTYNPGDTIKIYGVKYRNATNLHFSGNLQSVGTKDVSVTESSTWKTLTTQSMTIPSGETQEGNYRISLYAENDAGDKSETDITTLLFTLEMETVVTAALDMSGAYLDKDVYHPGETITISGVKYKDAVDVCFDSSLSSISTKYVDVTESTSWKKLSSVKLAIPSTEKRSGSYVISVFADNRYGDESDTDSTTLTFTFSSTPALALASVAPDKTSAKVGDTVTWTATATGGASGKTYRYRLYNGSTQVYRSEYVTANTFSYTLTAPGTYYVNVIVTDSEDSDADLDSCNVTVTASAPVMTAVTPNVTSTKVGGAITWTATATGGAGGNTYRFDLYKSGVLHKTGSYAAAATFSHTFTEVGSYTVRAYVKDSASATADLTSGAVTVTANAPVMTAVTPSAATATVGGAITWTATATGGAGGNTYCFDLYRDNVLYKAGSYAAANTFVYSFTEAGSYTVRATVKDSASAVASLTSGAVTVTANAPVMTTVAPSAATAKAGDTITWTAKASGGSGGNYYRFYVYFGNTIVMKSAYSTVSTFSYTFAEAGSYAVRAYVVDSKGVADNLMGGYVTVVPGAPRVVSVTSNASSAEVGGTVTWTAKASGGVGGSSFRFYLYNGNEIIKKSAYSAANTFSYTFMEVGNYAVRAYVMDSESETGNLMGGYVTVTAGAPTVTSVKPSVSSAVVGSTVTWTAKSTGGAGGNSFRFYLYNGNTVMKKGVYSTANTFSYTLTEAGTYAVRVYVMDLTGAIGNTMGGYVTVTAGAPTVTSVTPNVSSAVVGAKVTWTAKASGGTGGKYYRFYLYKGDTVITKSAYTTANTFTYILTETGTYAVRAYAMDAANAVGNTIGGYVTVTAGAPTVTSVTPNASSAIVGGTVTWTAKASGGAGGDYYRFYLYKGDTVIMKSAYTTANDFSYTFKEAGTYAVRVYAMDAANAVGNIIGGYVTVTEGPLKIVSVTANATSASVGRTITWTVKVSGGAGGYLYRFYLYKGNVIVEKSAYTDVNTYAYTTSDTGVYAIRVYLIDSRKASDNMMNGYVKVE